jgi:hypothetical protein
VGGLEVEVVMTDFESKPDMRATHGRFVRLFLEHKAEAGVASLSDEQVVEQAGEIFLKLRALRDDAARKGDGETLIRLEWFTHACEEEFDDRREAPPRSQQH